MTGANPTRRFDSPEALDAALVDQAYVTDAELRMTLYLAMALGKPLLVEGPAGVGKTEIARALAAALDTRLIRLQCYEGLDAAQALYEWDYPRQLLEIRLQEAAGASADDLAGFVGMAGPYDFLPIEDPVLQAIFAPRAAWARTQPIHFVTGEASPMLLMHGGADRTVAPENSRNMASRVNDRGGEARLKIYPETTHVGLIAPLAAPLRLAGDQLDDIADFVTKVVSDRNR